jgi:pilus assembly protein CpaB
MPWTHTPVARLGLAAGLSLAITTFLYVTVVGPRGAQKAEAAPKAAMITVAHPIPAYTKLTADDLVVKQVASDMVPEGALREVSMATSRLTKQPMFPGEPVMEAKLFASGQESPSSLPLPKGKRAVTVAVNEVVGVAGFISVGSIVDVIATMDVEQKAISRIILQDIQVLAAAQNPQPEDDGHAKVVSSVTLAVTPEEAEALTMATEKGQIRLAMRNPLESGETKTSGMTPGALVGLKPPAPKAAPAKAPSKTVVKTVTRTVGVPVKPAAPADPGIMVIRGTTTTFVNR